MAVRKDLICSKLTLDQLELISKMKINCGRLHFFDNQITNVVNDGDNGDLSINYTGYAEGTTRFRDFGVFDGKEGVVFFIDGSEKLTTISGAVNIARWESKVVFLNENVSNVANKPTLIDIGLFKAYSLPEYAAGEELLFSMRVPHDWDGVTNPYFVCPSIITIAEDVDDKYQFQLEWQSADVGGVFPVTIQETLTDEVTVTDGTQYRAEILAFELNAATLARGQNLQMRLRRIAASSSSVTGEIAITHWDTRWKCSRIGTQSIQGY